MNFVVGDSSIRLDVFLARECALSRSAASNVITSDGAVVNGVRRFKSGFDLKAGDSVEFEIPAPKELNVEAADIPLKIVYQDDNFAVIDLSLIHI